MINSLPNLSLGDPSVRCVGFLTIVTLKVINYEFYYEALLKESTIHYFFLHCELNFKPPRVRLCVKEAGINELNSLKALNILQTER